MSARCVLLRPSTYTDAAVCRAVVNETAKLCKALAQHVIRKSLKFRVRNLTRGTSLGDAIEVADDSASRAKGLLKRDGLDEGTGLWIVPCEAIHTFFMRFTIDVIYIDRKRLVRKAVKRLAPWRLSACLPAHSVLELPAGTIDRTNTQKGDRLEIEKSG